MLNFNFAWPTYLDHVSRFWISEAAVFLRVFCCQPACGGLHPRFSLQVSIEPDRKQSIFEHVWTLDILLYIQCYRYSSEWEALLFRYKYFVTNFLLWFCDLLKKNNKANSIPSVIKPSDLQTPDLKIFEPGGHSTLIQSTTMTVKQLNDPINPIWQ